MTRDDTNETPRPRISEGVRKAFAEMDEATLEALQARLADTDPEAAQRYKQIWESYRFGLPGSRLLDSDGNPPA